VKPTTITIHPDKVDDAVDWCLEHIGNMMDENSATSHRWGMVLESMWEIKKIHHSVMFHSDVSEELVFEFKMRFL
jgi:hypothetical protein